MIRFITGGTGIYKEPSRYQLCPLESINNPSMDRKQIMLLLPVFLSCFLSPGSSQGTCHGGLQVAHCVCACGLGPDLHQICRLLSTAIALLLQH